MIGTLRITVIVCPNPDCRQQTISAAIYDYNAKCEIIGNMVYS
jgi:hypothetical protein